MNVCPEIPPLRNSLIHLNINSKKPLETVDIPILNLSLRKPVPTKQKDIGSVTLFGLIRLSIEQSRQILGKGFSNYCVTTSHPPTSFTKYLITLKMSYCCTQNVASIIRLHNKKLINASMKNILPCNCRTKHECPLDGKCRAENVVYKCVASVDGYPNKVYLGTAEGDFK